MPKKLPQPRPEAPTELWRQADILLNSGDLTREDYRQHMRYERVRPTRGRVDEIREDGSTVRSGEVEMRVRDTGDLVQVFASTQGYEYLINSEEFLA